ncbi:glycosyltransferase involved in cell wall biosynthesis [Flavobacterium sp. HSC-32F16]|uniref:glycosyltransferase n=1 Tax=Flavobacterium sp. HSC-32F16 TaxID=2910964 RepID=UPI0020A30077|nr:glycosyltransferase [Flavobacterium sp. HSC-32F16]MCP2029157.1 glycosyltransferase involved in cell wall biosynthesis [Flavobacterium sp. HSC-32F16]
MRIVQIIDSLEPGGAERMAVNYANVLSEKIEFSGLISTRKEGLLLNQINKEVSYLFLNKNKKVDFKAVLRLRRYLKKNQISLIQAHSSSFFTAVLVKITYPKIKIIWHDHYGISQDLNLRKNLVLKVSSFFFSGVISVNSALKNWSESYLWCSNVKYFPNFVSDLSSGNEKLLLKGVQGKRIVCVANLRPQKNHNLLIEAANVIRDQFPEWTFHLFGKDFLDSYSKQLKQKVKYLQLQENVSFYGAVNNIGDVLKNFDIAVLPSLSEGLPLAVLEYGLHKLPVVATNVGEISKVIVSDKYGLVVESGNLNQLVESLQSLIENKIDRIQMGIELSKFIQLHYGQESIIKEYLFWINPVFSFLAADNSL